MLNQDEPRVTTSSFYCSRSRLTAFSDMTDALAQDEMAEFNNTNGHGDAELGSTDSGSLTQRAAMIRDELLGNDSLEQDTVHASGSSSGSSSKSIDGSSEKDENGDPEEELEQRLSKSSIAHSLRHIAVAFDEKVSRNARPDGEGSSTLFRASLELSLADHPLCLPYDHSLLDKES